MQLSKMNIAGFKSFVDPTQLTLPGKLIAVVGPNGCGKSNIIDAVTWVMGESSPKYLRGESSTDVIFNGSSSRKPVGQASVELIFDNSDGSIGGSHAKFAEISIRRVITRDGESTYYLNRTKCRKRDVIDIFLGTGVGPRSYSIIGQNMITKVTESKPAELRLYLEEAAGTSKYKERRHETELRIQHTKENLARVVDLKNELEKQLSHLKHQANVAEKFKTLKQQERVLRAELLAIQWRQLDCKMVDHTLQIQREETALEARNSELTGTDREIEQLRHEQRVAHDAYQEIQRRYYSVGNEITRIEQDMLHHQARQQQWENELKNAENEWQNIKQSLAQADDGLRATELEIVAIEPNLQSAIKDSEQLQNDLSFAEDDMQNWQNKWDEFNQIAAKSMQVAQVEKARMQQLDERLALLKKRQEQLQHDQAQFNFSELEQEVEGYEKKSYEVAEKLEYHNKHLTQLRQEIATVLASQKDSAKHLDSLRSDLQRLRGQEGSLEALQQTALGQRDNAALPWMSKHHLTQYSRLAEHLQVEAGWEKAVEIVLGSALQALCTDDIQKILSHLTDFSAGKLCIFKTTHEKSNRVESDSKGILLLAKIESPWPLNSLLSGIYIADDLVAALVLAEKLSDHESVITKDGVWVNRSWVKVLKDTDVSQGIFEREQELKKIFRQIEHLQNTQKELENNIAARQEQIQKLETERDQLQQTVNQFQAQSSQIQAQQKIKQENIRQLKSRYERFIKEHEEINKQFTEVESELSRARSLWQQALSESEEHEDSRNTLITERDHARDHLQVLRNKANQAKQKVHELELKLQKCLSQKTALQQNITQLQTQLTNLNERKITLQSELASIPPIDTLKKSLTRALDKHVSVEAELNSAKVSVEALEHEFKNLEEKRQIIERDVNKIRNNLEHLRVEIQGWKVKTETIIEQLKETEFLLEEVLKGLPQEISAEEWQAKLDQVAQRINRLGPINLVAIDEYATCLERKEYLDKQLEDLQSGLLTLEDAIAKIDRETKARFKETFDKVNQRFQELFPTIFGGGKAYLELTDDNLLEAGIILMASPPGKRNSTIHLLSGGEKSLTAIAFIFSIFYLNPAPFCMLDEVDAALDDANVVRFTRLVKTMADKTQFIFISHNKITIEMADQLIGVTMSEPGVSRLVSVDIEKAINLAGA